MMEPNERASHPKFAQAMEELEKILREIRDDEVDVDDLAVKVERAAALVKLCREKIDTTEVRLKEIIGSLDAPQPAGSDEEELRDQEVAKEAPSSKASIGDDDIPF